MRGCIGWALAALAPALAYAQTTEQVAREVNPDPNFEARYCAFLSSNNFQDHAASLRWAEITIGLEQGRPFEVRSDISRDAFALMQQADSQKAQSDYKNCNARLAVIEAEAKQSNTLASSSSARPSAPAASTTASSERSAGRRATGQDSAVASTGNGRYSANPENTAGRGSGIVRKSDAYWRQYASDIGMEPVRRTFNGEFAGLRDNTHFKAQVHGFSEIYSAQCKSEIPSFKRFNIPSSRIASTTIYVSGRVENNYESTVIPIDIDTRLAPFYEVYEDSARAYILQSTSKIKERSGDVMNWTLEDLGKVFNASLNFNMWDAFFKQHGCTSATMLQMRDNLLRVANAQNSAQRDGVRYPGAERESEAR